MSNQGVLITYSPPQPFQTSESWTRIRAALVSQLPLRNIHWKSPSRPSIRTIQELDATFVLLETSRDEHTSQIPVTLLERPLLNIYIVTCEDGDIDSYRSTVKRQIKDWHAAVVQRKNQEWLILHIVRPDARMPTGNFFQLRGSVLDKVKTDFNADKRDRCVQLVWSGAGNDNPAIWADLITKIKDGLLSAFDSAVFQREEDVKRSESQRQMPGWNFCTFFILKESLASSFEGVNLFDDALQQYDELEILFYQVLKEKNLSWFGTLITPSAEDDSSPLLSISKKPYRELILANNISVFDFRIYLLSRQCALLGKMGRVNEVSRKAGAFLGGFGRRLRDVQADLPEFFVESWTYSSALSVVDQCETWAADSHPEESNLPNFHAGKGELIELALNQLDTIGIKVGHLPAHPPFSTTFAQSPERCKPTRKRSSLKISKAELLSSLESCDAFYDLYVSVTNRAIEMYTKAGRRKFALKLHGTLAALDVHRGRLSTAAATYASLPAHYAPHMWRSLESFMLSRALDTHADLGNPKDKEWILTALSFLKSFIDNAGEVRFMHKVDKVEYVSGLVRAMMETGRSLESDLVSSNHPAVSITVSSDAKMAEDEDGSFLDATIQNHLPCTLPIEEVSVLLAGRDTERFRFTLATQALEPGKTTLQLFCPTSSSGMFLLDSSEIRISHIILQQEHRRTQKHPKVSTLVRIPRDLRAMNVRLCQPHRIELGTPSKLLLAVQTGRNHILNATLKLSAPTGIHFEHSEATLQSHIDSITLQVTNDSIKIMNVSADQTIPILVPYSDTSSFNTMKVSVDVEYISSNKPTVTRTLGVIQTVSTFLPVGVNVQDFFRGTRLFSKFTISTTNKYVRISSAQLEIEGNSLDGVQIVGCLTQNQCITVTPAQPANFLFSLESIHGPVRESLILLIKYRMLHEEVESLIKTSVEEVIAETPSLLPHRIVLVSRLVDSLEANTDWVESYRLAGKLDISGASEDGGELGEALALVKQNLRRKKFLHSQDGEWHEILYPVDVPRMTIVAAARVSILSTSSTTISAEDVPSLYAGQPISAILTIHTSFHWGLSAGDKERKYMMQFDIEEMSKDWLVSGKKRGDFAAVDDATHTVPISLIALHHGEVTLPRIDVTALPLTGEYRMGSMAIPSTETYQLHGAEKVLVLPRGGRNTFVVGMGESPSDIAQV